jgi:hypothetical protein
MPNPFEVMTDVNLFCGATADGGNSNHLILTELKLPTWEERYVDWRPGGANVAIEIDVQMMRLQASFTLVGMTRQVMKLLRPTVGTSTYFTAYGVIRDMVTLVPKQAVAIMFGRLGRIEAANFRREEVLHSAYAIRGLTYYRLVVAGFNQDTGVEETDEIYNWDFMTNTFLVGGV